MSLVLWDVVCIFAGRYIRGLPQDPAGVMWRRQVEAGVSHVCLVARKVNYFTPCVYPRPLAFHLYTRYLFAVISANKKNSDIRYLSCLSIDPVPKDVHHCLLIHLYNWETHVIQLP